MESGLARVVSHFVDEDVDRVKREAVASSRWQREYFSSLRYSIDLSSFPLGARDELPFRKFECDNIWMVRGADNMESDLGRFVDDVRRGMVGYLTAATGLGKSTTLLRRVVQTIQFKTVTVLPEDKLAKVLNDFLVAREVDPDDYVDISFLVLGKHAEIKLTQLTFMSASTFLILMVIHPDWLDRYEVKLVYVDEAHFESDEYYVFKALTMVKALGNRTVCYTTATPPVAASTEMYRRVKTDYYTFPMVQPDAKLKDVLSKTEISGLKLKGSVIVFAISNDFAKSLAGYYTSCDLDVTLHITDSPSKEWEKVLLEFISAPVATRVLVTTTLFEYGVTAWFDVVVNFMVKEELVSDKPGAVIKKKLRATTKDVNVQRAGRAGRIGNKAKVFEMEAPPEKSDHNRLASYVRRYCWFQLFNIKSNADWYRTAAVTVGDVHERKLWYLLSASMHPVLLLKYMTSDGLVKRPFLEALKLYFPPGFRCEVSPNDTYDQATAEFGKYTRVSVGQTYRIPLDEENYFLCDMVYVDHVSRVKTSAVEPAESLWGDLPSRVSRRARFANSKLPTGLHERLKVKPVEDVTESSTVSLEREEAKASLENYEGLPKSPIHVVQDYSLFDRSLGGSPTNLYNLASELRTQGRYSHVCAPSSQWRAMAKTVLEHPDGSSGPMGDDYPTIPRTRHSMTLPNVDHQLALRPRMDVSCVPDGRPVQVVYDTVPERARSETTEPPRFHPQYVSRAEVVRYEEPNLPVMYVEPKKPTFRQVNQIVSIEDVDGRMVFPFANLPAQPDRYARPSSSEQDMVYNVIRGRHRISAMNRQVRETCFVALIRVWNANVVDHVQYEGRREDTSLASYGSSSRRGVRFSTERLMTLFQAFEHYGLSPSVPKKLATGSVQGFGLTVEATKEQLMRVELSKVLAMKDPSMSVDWKVATEFGRAFGPKGIGQACGFVVDDNTLNVVMTVHLPRLREVRVLGMTCGFGYDLGAYIVAMGHVLGCEGGTNDLVKVVGAKFDLSGTGSVTHRYPREGEWLFVVVASPGLAPAYVVSYGGFKVALVGPLQVKKVSKPEAYCRCAGYAKKGMSGSPVISSVTGELVGLLWGASKENGDVMVSML